MSCHPIELSEAQEIQCGEGIKYKFFIKKNDIVRTKDGGFRIKRKYGKFTREIIRVI
jgi:hypothetical protein